jgi:hypothetical protein
VFLAVHSEQDNNSIGLLVHLWLLLISMGLASPLSATVQARRNWYIKPNEAAHEKRTKTPDNFLVTMKNPR